MAIIKDTWVGDLNIKVTTRFEYLVLTGLIILAALLRFYKLGAWSIWVEEHHSIRHAAAIDSIQSAITNPRPIFYLLTKLSMAWGVNEWTIRLIPAILGVVSIVLVYWIAKRLFGIREAFIAASLLTVSTWHIYWSQNARFYSLLLVFYTLSLIAFYWAIETDKFKYVIGSVVALAMAGATHAISALIIPVFIGYFLLLKLLPFEKPPGLRWRNLVPFVILPLVGYAAFEGILFLFGQRSLFEEIYLLFFNDATASFIGYAGPYIMLTAVVYYVGTPLSLLACVGGAMLLKERSRIGLLLSLTAFGTLAIMMLLTIFASTANRYVFMTLPCWIILGALAIARLVFQDNKRRSLSVFVLSGILVLLIRDPAVEDLLYHLRAVRLFPLLAGLGSLLGGIALYYMVRLLGRRGQIQPSIWSLGILFLSFMHPILTDSMYYLYQHGHREDWKMATAAVQENFEPGDMVLTAMPPVVSYYMEDEAPGDIRGVDLDQALNSHRRIWIFENEDIYQVMDTQFREWADQHCQLVDNWDQYAIGRTWPLRTHLCTSDGDTS